MLALLSVAVTSATSVAPEATDLLESRPYLTTVGAPTLRFAAAIPPPDLTVRLPAGGPPIVAEEHPSEAEKPKADVTVSAPSAQSMTASSGNGSATPGSNTSAAEAEKPAAKPVPPILPDDTRPKVRAEDFLPFFQYPAPGNANGDVTVVAPVPTAPAPAPLPPSSATYRQQ